MNKPAFDTQHPYLRQCPDLGTGPVPVAPVVSPEYFEREREAIFKKVWLNLGRVEDIPNPGDVHGQGHCRPAGLDHPGAR